MTPRRFAADRRDRAVVEVGVKDVGLERGSRLARHDHERARQIHGALDSGDLRRYGGVEHVQLGAARQLPECFRQHLGAKARAAHAEQEHMPQSRSASLAAERLQVAELAGEVVRRCQPPQPPRLVGAGPERGVARPQPIGIARAVPGIGRQLQFATQRLCDCIERTAHVCLRKSSGGSVVPAGLTAFAKGTVVR
jgi:hypothetical protein